MKSRPVITFQSTQRKDERWAIGIYNDKGDCYGWLHWIESSDGRICRVSSPDFAQHSYILKEECDAICEELTGMYQREEIH